MSQITTGVRRIFSHPVIYDGFQNLMGAQAIREDLVANFIQPNTGSCILDVGCGTADILAHLPESIGYWGFDISRRYIDAAQRRFEGRGHFVCGRLDRDCVDKLPKFDAVLAISVLHHLDDEESVDVFRLAREALKDGGRMITIDPCLAADQNLVARFLIRRDRGQNVRDAKGYRSLAQKAFLHVEGTLRHRRWIPYTHWIMECSD